MLNDSESLLASATDLLNSWARELGVEEAYDERDIKWVIKRLWEKSSMKYFNLYEILGEVSRLDNCIVEDAKRLLETKK